LVLFPDLLWAALLVAASFWGFVALKVVPRTDPCDDRSSLVIAVGVQVALLTAAIGLTLVHGARRRVSGTAAALLVGSVTVLALGGLAFVWVRFGWCNRGATF
jgi:hypothetical protein